MYSAGDVPIDLHAGDGSCVGQVMVHYETIGVTECRDCGFDSVEHTIYRGPLGLTIWSGCGRCTDEDVRSSSA